MVEVAIKSRNDCTFCCGAEALFCENFIRIQSIYLFIMQILLLLFQYICAKYVYFTILLKNRFVSLSNKYSNSSKLFTFFLPSDKRF
jgi:hypothetical protein